MILQSSGFHKICFGRTRSPRVLRQGSRLCMNLPTKVESRCSACRWREREFSHSCCCPIKRNRYPPNQSTACRRNSLKRPSRSRKAPSSRRRRRSSSYTIKPVSRTRCNVHSPSINPSTSRSTLRGSTITNRSRCRDQCRSGARETRGCRSRTRICSSNASPSRARRRPSTQREGVAYLLLCPRRPACRGQRRITPAESMNTDRSVALTGNRICLDNVTTKRQRRRVSSSSSYYSYNWSCTEEPSSSEANTDRFQPFPDETLVYSVQPASRSISNEASIAASHTDSQYQEGEHKDDRRHRTASDRDSSSRQVHPNSWSISQSRDHHPHRNKGHPHMRDEEIDSESENADVRNGQCYTLKLDCCDVSPVSRHISHSPSSRHHRKERLPNLQSASTDAVHRKTYNRQIVGGTSHHVRSQHIKNTDEKHNMEPHSFNEKHNMGPHSFNEKHNMEPHSFNEKHNMEPHSFNEKHNVEPHSFKIQLTCNFRPKRITDNECFNHAKANRG